MGVVSKIAVHLTCMAVVALALSGVEPLYAQTAPPPTLTPPSDVEARPLPPLPPLPGPTTGNEAPPVSEPIEVAPGGSPVALGLPATIDPKLTWRVVNPFRFFVDPKDTEVHRATWESLSEDERKSPVLSAERQLSQRFADGWSASMYQRTCWFSERNRFICPDNPGQPYVTPKTHRVRATLQGIGDASLVTCRWTLAPVSQSGPAEQSEPVEQSCNLPFDLDVAYPASTRVAVSVGGSRIATADIAVEDLLIVGMGDSFASGEGNPDVPVRFSRERAANYVKPVRGNGLVGFPARVGSWRQIGDADFLAENARWLDQACHRSLYSSQLRAALQLSLEDPHRAVTYLGVACSGAEVTAGLFLRYKGHEWVPSPPDLSQISNIAVAQCGNEIAEPQDLPEAYHLRGAIPDLMGGLVLNKCDARHARPIDLIFVSVGGNDIGFARLVANAVLSDRSTLKQLGGWIGQVHGPSEAKALMANLDDRYKALNRALHNILHIPWSQSDRVVLTAYPPLALLDDGKSVCPDGTAGMEVVQDMYLSSRKAKAGLAAADSLGRIMKASARAHGWSYVEAHREEFIGRGICAGWVEYGLTSVDDLRLPRLIDGTWKPYNPADYRPYAPRQRWFRTPNDAFLTGHFHVSVSMMQSVLKLESLSWFQLLLAATYSGAFHPTAEGQAAIADAIVDRSRQVLAKYDERARSDAARAD